MNDLKGKIALVTGGGSGINLAFVKLLYDAGCNILIADLSLHHTAQAWLSTIETDGRVAFQQTDVTEWSQLERTMTACQDHFKDVPDIIVPGAGIYEPSTNSFWNDLDSASSYKVLDVNLVHPIKLSRTAIRALRRAGKGGTIVCISSIAGQRSSVVTPLYTASKHGVTSFIRSMAMLEEMAGIRVVGVAPGYVRLFLIQAAYDQILLLCHELTLLLLVSCARPCSLIIPKQPSSSTCLKIPFLSQK